MIPVLLACLLGCGAVDGQQRGTASRTYQQRENVPGSTPSVMGLQGYSVVLVIGDLQGTSSGDTVPAAARKALTDMQAFLPYKRYQLLDSAWMVCCGSFRTPLAGRLRGPEERDYAYSIETLSGEAGKLTVRFSLRDGDGVSPRMVPQAALSETARAEYSRQLYEARKELSDADVQYKQMKRMHDAGTASETDYEAVRRRYQLAQTRAEELERTLNGQRGASTTGRFLLDSTFSIAVGETVVIGTSRLKGDQALIALLTAATKPTAAR